MPWYFGFLEDGCRKEAASFLHRLDVDCAGPPGLNSGPMPLQRVAVSPCSGIVLLRRVAVPSRSGIVALRRVGVPPRSGTVPLRRVAVPLQAVGERLLRANMRTERGLQPELGKRHGDKGMRGQGEGRPR